MIGWVVHGPQFDNTVPKTLNVAGLPASQPQFTNKIPRYDNKNIIQVDTQLALRLQKI